MALSGRFELEAVRTCRVDCCYSHLGPRLVALHAGRSGDFQVVTERFRIMCKGQPQPSVMPVS